MPTCSKCYEEKNEDDMHYFPYLDQWVCNDCQTLDDKVEDGYLEFLYNI